MSRRFRALVEQRESAYLDALVRRHPGKPCRNGGVLNRHAERNDACKLFALERRGFAPQYDLHARRDIAGRIVRFLNEAPLLLVADDVDVVARRIKRFVGRAIAGLSPVPPLASRKQVRDRQLVWAA